MKTTHTLSKNAGDELSTSITFPCKITFGYDYCIVCELLAGMLDTEADWFYTYPDIYNYTLEEPIG